MKGNPPLKTKGGAPAPADFLGPEYGSRVIESRVAHLGERQPTLKNEGWGTRKAPGPRRTAGGALGYNRRTRKADSLSSAAAVSSE